MLEECGLDYNLHPLNIGKGEQFEPAFLDISPNNRMPAIVDHDPASHGNADGDSDKAEPVSVFESGAILFYLAEKTGRFISSTAAARKQTLEWLFWQTANQGPMAGQLSHFVNYAPGEHPYSKTRYANEYNRCLGVLERRLTDREFIVDDYSIADMICWPWVLIARPLGQSLDDFPNVRRWRQTVKERPGVQRGVELGKEFRRQAPPTDEERRVLFNQNAESISSKD